MRPKGSKAELEARRVRAIAMLQEGLGVCEVADRVGVWPGSVSRWKQAYKRAGREGLEAKRHPGSKPKLKREDRQRLAQLLLQGPLAHGYKTDLWTLRRVAEVVQKQFEVSYHPGHVWRLLRSMNWSCQKPERRAREREEEAIRRWHKQDWPGIKKSPQTRL